MPNQVDYSICNTNWYISSNCLICEIFYLHYDLINACKYVFIKYFLVELLPLVMLHTPIGHIRQLLDGERSANKSPSTFFPIPVQI